MADAAQPAQHEFWRPPMQSPVLDGASHSDLVEACDSCGTEFIVGSRYCHTCGARRPGGSARDSRAWLKVAVDGMKVAAMSAASLRGALGLPVAAFAAFLAGVACVVGALGVGVIFSARTVLDWQAVQMWRIEWLLGAVAMFTAGCLLKSSRNSG
ncbi:MAG TPA: hypothetical protein VLT90_10960 [Terriglobales bacterium]|nr:hypothetical protein [Terriglobales bacterium]